MTSHVKLRKERVGVVDYDTQMKEVRCQLVDQLKVLDTQLEQKSQQLQDLTDYLRRRGEIEGEYARSLDKLAERFTSKIKKKEPSGQTVAQVWLALLSQTRQESRDHNGLSERCSNLLTQPLTYCLEYTQRLAKRSKEVCSQLQEGLLKATTELQTVWRTYYQYHSDYVSAEGKLKDAEKLEEKQKQSTNKKVERLIEKRQGKVQDIHLKCSKARNDYLLNLAAANGSMSNYYLKDISSLIDCADAGYHLSLSRVMQAYLSSHWRAQNNLGTGLQQLQGVVSGLDQNRDRDILLQAHHNTFCLPLRFLYQPHDGDQVSEVSAEGEMRCDLETRFKQIQTRLTVITQETEQAGNSLLAAHSSLLEIISDDDLETNGGSGPTHEGSNENLSSKPSAARRKANLQETENLYVTRVREYLFGSSLESKLQAKHDLLKVAVEKAEATDGHQPRPNTKSKHMRKNKSNPNLIHNQKLFTGDMLDFLKASGQEIPLVVESCICYINLNGLHHEGIFRVPGSQGEVNNLRDAFEKGDEPLAEQSCDLDSVAGVLKLYFRGLEKPLFPFESTSQLLECTQVDNEAERAAQLKAVVSSFPAPTVVVMRYLFSFLHHVSQYSDENMMQPYNLAVCFGPSLVRCPQDDAVTLLPQINSLVKNLIVQHETVFPSEAELPGPVYEKCMTLEEDDCEPMMEEGDGDELETGTTGDRSTSPSPAQTQKKGERLRANSNHNPSVSRGGPTGGSVAPGVKFALQIPIGPQGRPQGRTHSPGFLRREGHDHSSSEDITVHVNKEVCRQMDSVFKELLIRQTHQDPTSTSTVVPPSSVQPPQKKGGREGRRGRASGLFKSADQLD